MSVSHRYPEVSPSWSLSLLFNFCFKPKVLVHFAALSLPKDREADSCATPVKWGWTCTAFRAEFPEDNPPPLSLILRACHGSSTGFLCFNNPFTPVQDWEETEVIKGRRAPVSTKVCLPFIIWGGKQFI